MIDKDKNQMLNFIDKFKTDKKHKNYINSTDLSELPKIEHISDDEVEVIESDFSNHYDEYNPIDTSNLRALEITCMNMAIGELLHLAFNDNNIGNYSDFNLADIKTRCKDDLLYSTMDKPDIIRFIRTYNQEHPEFLPKHAEEFFKIHEAEMKSKVPTSMFNRLAQTFNTNIYLDELFTEEKKSAKK